eukprot:Pompholyxophrys_sp_v1_NODE_474_length_531_cov_21.613445.p1 type:complete len:106 gc:universal NODE_474_length_531_cov_21.613445:210-527(+)
MYLLTTKQPENLRRSPLPTKKVVFQKKTLIVWFRKQNIHNTVRINIKGNFDLRYTTRSRWDSSKFKFPQQKTTICWGNLNLLESHLLLVVYLKSKLPLMLILTVL